MYAARIGLAGVVVHGTIRDVDQMAQMRYPVWSDRRAAGASAGSRRVLRERAIAENVAAERIAAGKSLWELHDLDAAYRRLGVIEHLTDWDGQQK